MCYELRKLTDDHIDWNSSCYSPSHSELSCWRKSFAAFTDTKAKVMSNT